MSISPYKLGRGNLNSENGNGGAIQDYTMGREYSEIAEPWMDDWTADWFAGRAISFDEIVHFSSSQNDDLGFHKVYDLGQIRLILALFMASSYLDAVVSFRL